MKVLIIKWVWHLGISGFNIKCQICDSCFLERYVLVDFDAADEFIFRMDF